MDSDLSKPLDKGSSGETGEIVSRDSNRTVGPFLALVLQALGRVLQAPGRV